MKLTDLFTVCRQNLGCVCWACSCRVSEWPDTGLKIQRLSKSPLRPSSRRADIGGSLIKLVYFSPDTDVCPVTGNDLGEGARSGGRLHFVKVRSHEPGSPLPFAGNIPVLARRATSLHTRSSRRQMSRTRLPSSNPRISTSAPTVPTARLLSRPLVAGPTSIARRATPLARSTPHTSPSALSPPSS